MLAQLMWCEKECSPQKIYDNNDNKNSNNNNNLEISYSVYVN